MNLAKRIQELEKGTRPRVISTLRDLVASSGEDVELSPELQELVEEAVCEPSAS
jgi:hypothetical protein